jgi:SAM-dependent methyltransferase
VTYVVRSALAAWVAQEARRAAADYGRYRVLDVGCGVKPYYPFFQPHAAEYVGVDIDNPAADLTGSVDELPVPDGSFDVVLCTQVLEHAADPERAVRELWRAAAPGGRVLASTHGVQVYHPAPEDYWRWTHAGLERLFRRAAQWRSVEVAPAAGAASCLAAMADVYVDLLCRRARLVALGRGLVWLANTAGTALDRRFTALREPVPGSLFVNYHVVAEKWPKSGLSAGVPRAGGGGAGLRPVGGSALRADPAGEERT